VKANSQEDKITNVDIVLSINEKRCNHAYKSINIVGLDMCCATMFVEGHFKK